MYGFLIFQQFSVWAANCLFSACIYSFHCPQGMAEITIQTFPVVRVSEGRNAILDCNVSVNGNPFSPCLEPGYILEWILVGEVGTPQASCDGIHQEVRFDNYTNALTIMNAPLSLNGSRYVCQLTPAFGDIVTESTLLLIEKSKCFHNKIATQHCRGNSERK